MNMRIVMIYKVSTSQPDTPVGGKWDTSYDAYTLPSGWSKTFSESTTSIVWMSTNTFSSVDGLPIGAWSAPIRITGKDGKAGADGTDIEFIFRRTEDSATVPDTPQSSQEDDYVPDDWTDNPQGITEKLQAEWVSTR